MKCFAAIALLMVLAVTVRAQENAPIPLQLDVPGLTDKLLQPILPQLPTPVSGQLAKPALTEPIRLDWRKANLRDSLRLQERMDLGYMAYPTTWRSYNFVRNPYSRNFATGGIIATVGGGYLAGSSSYTAMPALGNIGTASVSYTQPLGDRWVFTAGMAGNKYHFGRVAWNSYGVFGRASFRLNEKLTLNAFGQHYWNQRVPGVAALPYMQDTRYGGTLGMKMSETVSLDVGAQRYYDPYTRQWKTVPIIAPTIQLMGQPISLDVGGLVYQLLDNIFGKRSVGSYDGYNNRQPYGVGLRPAGFNPHSPVRIPDALR